MVNAAAKLAAVSNGSAKSRATMKNGREQRTHMESFSHAVLCTCILLAE